MTDACATASLTVFLPLSETTTGPCANRLLAGRMVRNEDLCRAKLTTQMLIQRREMVRLIAKIESQVHRKMLCHRSSATEK